MSSRFRDERVHKAQQQRKEVLHTPVHDERPVFRIQVSDEFGLELTPLMDDETPDQYKDFCDLRSACDEAQKREKDGAYAEVVDEHGKVWKRYGMPTAG